MHYEGDIIRPPSEANSILLEITVGCSHHKCTFCAFWGKRFKIKSDEQIFADIQFAADHCKRQRRIFLCGCDALIMPQKRLLNILTEIRQKLPWVTRVGVYANAKGLKMKTPEELQQLRENGLGIAYMGLESGDDTTLKAIHKGASAQHMIQMAQKAKAAGIKLSVTVILGVAGRERSQTHARETGRALSAIDPEYVGALSLMLVADTPLYEDASMGRFTLIQPEEMLAELRTIIAETHQTQGLFHANHASNYLPIRARMPKDKDATLALIDGALAGKVPLRPEWSRGL